MKVVPVERFISRSEYLFIVWTEKLVYEAARMFVPPGIDILLTVEVIKAVFPHPVKDRF